MCGSNCRDSRTLVIPRVRLSCHVLHVSYEFVVPWVYPEYECRTLGITNVRVARTLGITNVRVSRTLVIARGPVKVT